ncbi:MAG: NrfD/PsrC family molybdoenzyme membrane anchor subunit [Myxococcaceae bacterium]
MDSALRIAPARPASARAGWKSHLTPFNVISAIILAGGLPVIAYRFVAGLGASTNLTQSAPWGIWIGFDMMCGVALAAGGFTVACAVYVFGLEDYRPIVRPAILTGFLGYVFAVFGLLADLGRPWRIPWPLFNPGPTSVMYEVAWCVVLYSAVLALEFSVSLFEWLGWTRLRNAVLKVMIGATVLGVVLSTLHQSSLGSLFLMAPTKLHPLWYSGFIPIYFFISAIIAGLSMVIVESSLSHRIFKNQLDPKKHVDFDKLTLGLGKAAAVILFAYFFLKLQGVADGNHWGLLATGYGLWFGVEVVGFVLVPCFLFAFGTRARSVGTVRIAAALTVLGVVLNRLNIAVIAMNWNAPKHYLPSWMEVVVSITIVLLGLLTFRFIINRMPVLRSHPAYQDGH